MKSIKSIFVDEAGTTSIKSTDGKDRLYISVAVVVNTSDIESITANLDEISNRLNHGAEFKSSKIGNNDERRISFLKEFRELPFRYYVLVVDKTKCPSDGGLAYRRSAYKFFANQLYTTIDNRLANVSVDLYVDNYGTQEFQHECEKYFNSKCELFTRASIVYKDDKTSRLVQLADMIAGTLRQYFYEEASIELRASVRSLLRDGHEIVLKQFPFNHRFFKTPSAEVAGSNEFDSTIARINIDRAVALVNEYDDSDDEIKQMMGAVLKMLLASYAEGTGNIFAERIQAELTQLCGKPISKQMMQSKVIGGLRFNGIIIAGDKKGYRLATTERDLRAYLAHDNSVIMPMLAKLNKARSILSENADMDPLERYSDFIDLKSIADKFRELEMEALDAMLVKGRDESDSE